MAKSTYRSIQTMQLFLALFVGVVIGATVMAYLNKSFTTRQTVGESESISNNDDIPSLEKDLQLLKSTNPFKN